MLHDYFLHMLSPLRAIKSKSSEYKKSTK